MRILFIVPYMPNLVRVRSYQFIRSLTKRGHELTVATLWTNTAEKQAMSALEAQCQEVIAFPMGKARSFGNCLG
ncbi:MAG: glycosyl transferase family 1, partial [Anaerolineaceae bacterium]